MDLESTRNILAMIIGNTLCALVFIVPLGALFLWFACWLYNHAAGVDGPNPNRRGTPAEARTYKTTDAGPYTAPGSESQPEGKSAHPEGVPMPTYPHCCAIVLCSSLAVAVVNIPLQAVLWNFQGLGPEVWFFAPMPVSFLLATAIHAAMLQTTFLRAMLVNLLMLLPIIALGIALGIVCLAAMPKSFH